MPEFEERKQEIQLQLAERILKTIPEIPEDFHKLDSETQERLFRLIDERSAKVTELLGGGERKTGRGPARNPRSGPRPSERFNTPQLDTQITPVKKRRIATDE